LSSDIIQISTKNLPNSSPENALQSRLQNPTIWKGFKKHFDWRSCHQRFKKFEMSSINFLSVLRHPCFRETTKTRLWKLSLSSALEIKLKKSFFFKIRQIFGAFDSVKTDKCTHWVFQTFYKNVKIEKFQN